MKSLFRILVPAACILVAACEYNTEDYELNENDISEIISLEIVPQEDDDNESENSTLSENELAADGFSTLEIHAVISPPNADHRTINFTASNGTLLGSTSGIFTTDAGAQGVAVATLRSSQQPGIARVRAVVSGKPAVIAETEVTFRQSNPDSTIVLTSSPNSMPADGASQEIVAAKVASGLEGEKRVVTFSIESGTLTSEGKSGASVTATPDADGVAIATITSPNVSGLSSVNALVNGVLRRGTIEFQPARPDFLELSTTTNQVKVNSSSGLMLTIRLSRNVGTVSANPSLEFVAHTANEDRAAIGFFRNIDSSSKGTVTSTFFPGDTEYRGTIEINVITLTENPISVSTAIEIVDDS